MALSHSPSVVTNGLVLYYDMNNTKKSWKGAPATNLIATVPYTSTVYTACTGPVSISVMDAENQPRTVNRYTITATGGVPRARIIGTGLTTGVNYSYSVKIRYNGGTYAQSWYIDSSKGNPEGSNNTFTSRTTSFTYIGNGWYQLVENFNFATCPTAGTFSNFGFTAPDATYLNQTFDAYDIQFEQNTVATPYVNGTRSNTQALVDLTNNNTVTVPSLTYAADNTFSFNGTSDSVTVPFNASTFTFNNEQTIIIWMKNQSPSTARRNPYNQAYGGAGTITHESDTYFNYYYGTAGTNFTPYTNHGSPFNVVVGETAMICITRNVTQTAWYKNGVLGNTQSNPYGATVVTGTANITIGSGYAGYFGGSIYVVQLYNRALTAAEVSQNFNALRGRYAL